MMDDIFTEVTTFERYVLALEEQVNVLTDRINEVPHPRVTLCGCGAYVRHFVVEVDVSCDWRDSDTDVLVTSLLSSDLCGNIQAIVTVLRSFLSTSPKTLWIFVHGNRYQHISELSHQLVKTCQSKDGVLKVENDDILCIHTADNALPKQRFEYSSTHYNSYCMTIDDSMKVVCVREHKLTTYNQRYATIPDLVKGCSAEPVVRIISLPSTL